jgi:hypothetical protein
MNAAAKNGPGNGGSSRRPAASRTPASRRRAGSPGARVRFETQPKIVRDTRAGDRKLIPTAPLVAEEVAAVPRGEVLTISNLRERLAARYGADRCCPVATGRLASLLCREVRQQLARGHKARWPIWRLVNDDGSLNSRWVLDARYRASRLREEGLGVTRDGRTWRVLGCC